MTYSIDLYKVPKEYTAERITEIEAEEILEVYDKSELTIAGTDFAYTNSDRFNFTAVFGIIVSHEGYTYEFTPEDLVDAKARYARMDVSEYLAVKIEKFIEVLETNIKEGYRVFFYCE